MIALCASVAGLDARSVGTDAGRVACRLWEETGCKGPQVLLQSQRVIQTAAVLLHSESCTSITVYLLYHHHLVYPGVLHAAPSAPS